jgi:hypothetical protein
MSYISVVKTAINRNIGSITSVYIISTNTKRGSREIIKIPDNCIFIFTTGVAQVNNISGQELNIILEGGDPNWEDALVNNKYVPYYSYNQQKTLNQILDYLYSCSPRILVRNNL